MRFRILQNKSGNLKMFASAKAGRVSISENKKDGKFERSTFWWCKCKKQLVEGKGETVRLLTRRRPVGKYWCQTLPPLGRSRDRMLCSSLWRWGDSWWSVPHSMQPWEAYWLKIWGEERVYVQKQKHPCDIMFLYFWMPDSVGIICGAEQES